ncbi:hypothetical protein [Microcystis sp. M42BS1]|uniref:hypothetical protein n=1 Tax=Microcystis sp. M42BS1 TaxID=2771192 RepID=UPI002587838B|nr:hypothetical protein [Microcystis sp. M42BS1]MCA2570672.1 hypothetical protein [Microcystis sp. M42BS1]
MTKEGSLNLANQLELLKTLTSGLWLLSDEDLHRFAELVASKEREAFMRMLKHALDNLWPYHDIQVRDAVSHTITNLMHAIRERGQP